MNEQHTVVIVHDPQAPRMLVVTAAGPQGPPGDPGIIVSDTPPPSPGHNALWVDSS